MGKRGVVLTAALTAVAGLTAIPLLLAPEACSIHNCDGSSGDTIADGSGVPPTGFIVDENTWESNPIDGQWLPFPGEQEWVLHFSQFAGRKVASTQAWVSADPSPGDTAANGGLPNWAPAAGNLAEFRDLNADYILVKNDTCSNYFLRVVLTFAEQDAAAPPPPVDAGIDAPPPDAPLSDAPAPPSD